MPRFINAYALQKRLSDCEFETNCVSEENKKEILKILRIFIPQIIASEPTADVEPVRHGRWYANNLGDAVCSNCKGIQNKYEVVFMPYCPNCGARMDGDAE